MAILRPADLSFIGKVVAKYADGVLNLTLPMKGKSAGRKIAIT